MAGWRAAAALGLVLAAGLAQAEEKYTLREKVDTDDQWQVDLSMQLQGELLLISGEKTVKLKLSAGAGHQFPERVLRVDGEGVPTRVARFYKEAKSDVTVHGDTTTRALRSERRFQVAQRIKDETVVYSPAGPLTRDELELTGGHLDVTVLLGLLPKEAVAVGQSWEIPMPVAQSLAGVDGLIEHNLRCKLDEVKGDEARVSIAGAVEGISNGSAAKITVEGWYLFDRKFNRLVSLTWKQKDERQQGPVTPDTKTESTTTVKRTFGRNSEDLTDGVVATVPVEPGPAHLLVDYRDSKGRFEFLHDRAWHSVAQTEKYAVLRLLDRGELIAQLNVTPWAKAKPGAHMSPQELRQQLEDTPNFTVDQVLQADEVPNDEGLWIHRLSVIGSVDDLRLLQNYYAVAGPQGDQVVLIFTAEVPQADKLAERDLSIVGTISFPKAK